MQPPPKQFPAPNNSNTASKPVNSAQTKANQNPENKQPLLPVWEPARPFKTKLQELA
jgi:hypothetical protein